MLTIRSEKYFKYAAEEWVDMKVKWTFQVAFDKTKDLTSLFNAALETPTKLAEKMGVLEIDEESYHAVQEEVIKSVNSEKSEIKFVIDPRAARDKAEAQKKQLEIAPAAPVQAPAAPVQAPAVPVQAPSMTVKDKPRGKQQLFGR